LVLDNRSKSVRHRTFERIAFLSLGFALTCSGEPLSVDDENGYSAHRLPLWECGLFCGAVRLPQYRGSDEYSEYFAPIPYFVYRGRVFRSGRDGMKGVFFRGEHVQTDLSLSGNPPVPRDNKAREGMPNLGAMIEIGPAIRYSFLGRGSADNLFLRASVRAALAIDVHDDLRSAGEGFRGGIDLSYLNKSLFEKSDFRFGGRLAVDFVDGEYSDYFYSVSHEYVLDSRPYYESKSGYAGFAAATYATKRLSDSFSLGAFASWINLNNTAFDESPLVKTKNNFVIGFALIWKLAESTKPASPEYNAHGVSP